MTRFRFRFTTPYRLASAPFGVTPATTMVEVDRDLFSVRYGPWKLETPLTNVAGCDETGPFRLVKAAGPARMSLVDRGISFATNGDRGLCVRFHEPVPGIEPLGRFTHPAATVTVERTEDLRRLLVGGATGPASERIHAESRGVAAESPWAHLARWVRYPPAMAAATWNYLWTLPEVVRTHDTVTGAPPRPMETSGIAEEQPIERGVGPVLVRSYRARISGCDLSPAELMAIVAEDLSRSSATPVSDFVDQRTTDQPAGVGTEYRIHMPGPWDAPVRVIERTPTSIRLATLAGHMEAGQIELRTLPAGSGEAGGDVIFEIRSIARSGDRFFRFLYDRLRLAREMQLYMWVDFCRTVCRLAEGELVGKIEVHTVEHR